LLDDVDPHWSDFFDVLRGAIFMQLESFWTDRKAALVCGLAGAVIACGITFLLHDRYVSSATIRMEHPEQLEAITTDLTSRSTLVRIMQSPDLNLYRSERRRQPLEDVIDTMRNRDLHIVRLAGRTGVEAVQVAFQGSTPREAQAVTRALTAQMLRVNPGAGLEMLDPASLPLKPFWPNRLAITFLGVMGGLVAGNRNRGLPPPLR
jgi:uncharacterized protein involved in exopolysaccharide biosynthesis